MQNWVSEKFVYDISEWIDMTVNEMCGVKEVRVRIRANFSRNNSKLIDYNRRLEKRGMNLQNNIFHTA